MSYPSDEEIASADCDELLGLLKQIREADVAHVRELDDLLSLEGEGPGGTGSGPEGGQRAQRQLGMRVGELQCDWVRSPPPASEMEPRITPQNRAQELYMATGAHGALEVALRATVQALETYRDEYGRYAHDMQELRAATDLGTPNESIQVSITDSDTDAACVKADLTPEDVTVYVSVPERTATFEPCD